VLKKLVLFLLAGSLIANFYFLAGLLARKYTVIKKTNVLERKAVRVIDGDTFDTEDNLRIRLAGISAPEYPDGCLALRARERLESLILGKTLIIDVVGEDNFGRQLGFVTAEGVEVEKAMLEEGLGRVQNGEDPRFGVILLAAEDSARKAKRGIWSSLCLGKEGCLIKGNVRRDRKTKTYHLPTCFNYEKIVVNEAEKDQWFCTEEEAKAAGFRKAEDCPEEKYD